MKTKILSIITTITLIVTIFACCAGGQKSPGQTTPPATQQPYNIGMVTDVGGINDQSFNQSAWTGLQQYNKDHPEAKVKYLESAQSGDYSTNLNQFASGGYKLVWGIGYLMTDAIKAASQAYPNTHFAIVDSSIPGAPKNLTCVVFRAQESSFLVGYIAAQKTKTNRVGFVGGVKGNVIDQFEYGYRAGVAYGAKELGKTVNVDVQYANSFSDASLGKGIAQNMYSKGADIIFSAAGNVGQGVITQAKDENKLCIGVDLDQSGLAPNNVLTSAMKNVGNAVQLVSAGVEQGKDVGGQTVAYGLKENGVGIPYTDQATKMAGQDILNKAKQVQQQIIDGKIVPPFDDTTFNTYMGSLK
jgi:basic membrane protein A